MKINLPTQLTLLRLILIPFFLIFTINDNLVTRIAALIIFIGASITDLYDGKLARDRGEVTTLGIFLDPLADKFLIASAFVAFVQLSDIYIPAWMVILILGREFLITGLRALAASKGRVLPAQPAGKFKTTSQIVTIIVILIILCLNSYFERYGGFPLELTRQESVLSLVVWFMKGGPYWLTFGTTLLTIFSGYLYVRSNIDLLHEDGKPHSS
ncbi:MAG: CDP-diacylglycerol--glycerol-3-phosphate 3-phosphatidyltransferase [Elusimicrobia bacterium]|nr:CDP-diacylglycerol--glycerol-3-phosphate 3-phosphatidyltransferase [Elusimicrobiota bacterium]